MSRSSPSSLPGAHDWKRRHPDLAAEFDDAVRMQDVLGDTRHDNPLEMPARLGGFRIVRRLVTGGMGELYEAEQEPVGRSVVVKIIRRGRISPQTRDCFLPEQEVLAKLHQTNIVPICAVGGEGRLQDYAMPHLNGAALDRVIRKAWDEKATFRLPASESSSTFVGESRPIPTGSFLKGQNVMITMLGSLRRCCDGLTRRETLKAGALSLLAGGFTLPQLLAAEERARTRSNRPGKAKSVILLYLLGGAATQDMWDMKPNAPADVRGEFKPIATTVPGLQICEHLPRMAGWMNRAALVRSVNHKAGCHNCLPSYTGYALPMPDQHPRASDPPSMGSICEYLNPRPQDMPAYVYMPCWLGWGQAFRRAGPYGGFLGKRYDALTTECQPCWDKQARAPAPGYPQTVRGEPILSDAVLGPELTVDRLDRRRDLLKQIDDECGRLEAQSAFDSYSRTQKRAFDLLTTAKVRSAFDLKTEDPRLLERYGRTLFGQSTLISRRLIEAGVRFVNVTWDLFWDRIQIDYDAWDTHTRNFPILRENKLPGLDQTYTALMEDLSSRGLLDETLVVTMSEMGRTPRINGNGGRDHWTYCYSVMFAGAGIQGGSICGASDAQAAFVKDRPVSPADICATIYQCLGIDPDMTVPDRSGRPVAINQGGEPIREILT